MNPLYSPLGLKRMEQYKRRVALLVKEGRLSEKEADLLTAAEMQRIALRLG